MAQPGSRLSVKSPDFDDFLRLDPLQLLKIAVEALLSRDIEHPALAVQGLLATSSNASASCSVSPKNAGATDSSAFARLLKGPIREVWPVCGCSSGLR